MRVCVGVGECVRSEGWWFEYGDGEESEYPKTTLPEGV